jgi:preprotein translocase subunit SecG
MVTVLTVLHVLVCVLLIVSILLQSSKGGGLAGMFGGGGGGGMGGVFGGRGAASFLARVAMWLGIGFAVSSILIAFFSSGTTSEPRSLIEQAMEQEQQTSSPATMLPTVPGGGGEQTGEDQTEPEKPEQE